MPRKVVIAAVNGSQSLDVTGPMEVFATADRLCGGDRYEVSVASTGDAFQCSSGLRMLADARFADLTQSLDTLVIAGGEGAVRACRARDTVRELDRVAGLARRIATVCTGAFLLAGTGRLDGRRATTHWRLARKLATNFPRVEVDPEPIFIRSGHIWTSAGVTAGIDLALELVADDLGRDAATRVARELVVYIQRPGGQAQFSAALSLYPGPPLLELRAWILEHPAEDLSVPALAARCDMGVRTLHRLVRRWAGHSPAAWVEQLRVDVARRALEASESSIATIASDSGFGTVSTMYRAFERTLGTTPADYRRHFPAGPAPLSRSAS